MQATLGIEGDDVLGVEALGQHEADDGGIGGASPVEDGLGGFPFLAGQLDGVDHARQGDAGGALGVVMPHGNTAVLKLVQHAEAVGLGDVFQVYGPEGGRHHAHELDDLVGTVFVGQAMVEGNVRAVGVGVGVGVDAEGYGVHTTQVVHEEGLALHHAQTAGRRAVAVAQHPGGIGDDGHQVATVGELVALQVVVPNGRGNGADPRGIPDTEPAEIVDARLGYGHHLAAIERVSLEAQPLEEDRLGSGYFRGVEVFREEPPQVLQVQVGREGHGSPRSGWEILPTAGRAGHEKDCLRVPRCSGRRHLF